jgi:hypothetical protein
MQFDLDVFFKPKPARFVQGIGVTMAELCDRPDQTNPVFCSNQTSGWTIDYAVARFRSDMAGLPPEFTTDTGDVRVVTADLPPGTDSARIDMCRVVTKPIRATEVTFSGKAWIFWNGNRVNQDLPVGTFKASDSHKQFFQGVYRIGWRPKSASPLATTEPPSLKNFEPLLEEIKA